MPLSASVNGERVVSSLLTEEQWAALRDDLRSRRRVLTMPCGWPGLAKTSRLGTRYFAHKPGGDGCTAGETAQHLLAKAIVVDAVTAAGWKAEPEVPGDGWIADVMATQGGVRVAFEVQWSNQTLDEYRRRQQRYRDSGIASIAWFTRHTDHLPAADQHLPVFALTINDAGGVHVRVDGTSVPLFEAVVRLLTRRLQHRDYYASGQPATAHVESAKMTCYRCEKPFAVWNARAVTVVGRCGGSESRLRETGLFAAIRPETRPEVSAVGQRLAQKMRLKPARIFSRATQGSGTRYMAFTCPHCNVTCGDVFVASMFSSGYPAHRAEATVPATAVHKPHWCLAGDDGCCPRPPQEVIDELNRLASSEEADSPYAKAASASVQGNVSIGQTVSRMFGAY